MVTSLPASGAGHWVSKAPDFKCTLLWASPSCFKGSINPEPSFPGGGVAVFIGQRVIFQKTCDSWPLLSVSQIPNTICHWLCNLLLKLEPLEHSNTGWCTLIRFMTAAWKGKCYPVPIQECREELKGKSLLSWWIWPGQLTASTWCLAHSR